MIATAPNPTPDFADLWREYHGRIFAYIYRKTSDPHLSEDMTADVFLKAIDSTQRGYGVQSSVSGWLHRIAHNAVIDMYRQRDRRLTVDLEAIATIPHSDTPHETVMQTLESEEVRATLQHLTDDQAQVLTMRYIEGYELGEIAEAIGKTEGAVKSLQHRASMNMRELLGNSDDYAIKPPSQLTPSAESIRDVLQEHGPLRLSWIVQYSGVGRATAYYTLTHCHLFTRVGVCDQGRTHLWGVVGVHDGI